MDTSQRDWWRAAGGTGFFRLRDDSLRIIDRTFRISNGKATPRASASFTQPKRQGDRTSLLRIRGRVSDFCCGRHLETFSPTEIHILRATNNNRHKSLITKYLHNPQPRLRFRTASDRFSSGPDDVNFFIEKSFQGGYFLPSTLLIAMKRPTLPLLIAAVLTSFIGITKTTASTTINYAFWGAPNSGQGVIGGADDIWNQISTNGTTSVPAAARHPA